MIKSMTGYGRAVQTFENREITVEIRSVNNRYLDCSVKLPRVFGFAEDSVKAKVKVKEDEARITLKLPASCEEHEDAVQDLLTGLMLTLCSARDDYPDYIEVMEV